MSEETLTVRVPLAVRKRGGRKVVLAPDRAAVLREREPPNWTLVKNLARGFRWQRMLESGEFATIAELAAREGIAAPYLTRVLRLAQLAPDLVESILDGRQPRGLTLESLREALPEGWAEQRRALIATCNSEDRGGTPMQRPRTRTHSSMRS